MPLSGGGNGPGGVSKPAMATDSSTPIYPDADPGQPQDFAPPAFGYLEGGDNPGTLPPSPAEMDSIPEILQRNTPLMGDVIRQLVESINAPLSRNEDIFKAINKRLNQYTKTPLNQGNKAIGSMVQQLADSVHNALTENAIRLQTVNALLQSQQPSGGTGSQEPAKSQRQPAESPGQQAQEQAYSQTQSGGSETSKSSKGEEAQQQEQAYEKECYCPPCPPCYPYQESDEAKVPYLNSSEYPRAVERESRRYAYPEIRKAKDFWITMMVHDSDILDCGCCCCNEPAFQFTLVNLQRMAKQQDESEQSPSVQYDTGAIATDSLEAVET